jgi:hypothetical protein
MLQMNQPLLVVSMLSQCLLHRQHLLEVLVAVDLQLLVETLPLELLLLEFFNPERLNQLVEFSCKEGKKVFH